MGNETLIGRAESAEAALAKVKAELDEARKRRDFHRHKKLEAKAAARENHIGLVHWKDRAEAASSALASMREALTEAEACMSIVEPRSDKAEYLRILGVVRAALKEGTPC